MKINLGFINSAGKKKMKYTWSHQQALWRG